MSLINDALKRARQVQQQSQPPAPSQLRPVEPAQVRHGPPFLLPGLIVVLLVVGGVFIGLALNKRGPDLQIAAKTEQTTLTSQQSPQPRPVAVTTPIVQAPQPAVPAPAAVAQNPGVTVPVEAGTPAVPSAASNSTNAGQIQQPVVESATRHSVPTLRGIYYNPSRPSAVLNSKNVYVGSSVNGFRVVEIKSDSVTVVGDGQTNVLTLPE